MKSVEIECVKVYDDYKDSLSSICNIYIMSETNVLDTISRRDIVYAFQVACSSSALQSIVQDFSWLRSVSLQHKLSSFALLEYF